MQPFPVRLLAWFRRHRRSLPWRQQPTPWAVWVSEVMLQQTRVEAVREPFQRFLQRFPTPADFAAATDDELLAAWRGLGYYRRARLLRDGARAVVQHHGGRVPNTLDELGALPGVGSYTRGAIGSIAYGIRTPAIDGNVERVVARHRGLRSEVKSAASQRSIHANVSDWLQHVEAGDFNQALMELGALVCKPERPACERCPVAIDCIARQRGWVAELPQRKAPPPPIPVTARVVLLLKAGTALGTRLPAGEVNAGQVELPGPGMLRDIDPDDLGAALRERFAAEFQVGHSLGSVRHAITRHRITLHAHAATLRRQGRLEWFPLTAEVPWSTPSRKLFRLLSGVEKTLRA